LIKNNVRLRVLGSKKRLSDDILNMIKALEETSANNTGLNLNIALDYGARQEILDAVQSLLSSHNNPVNEQEFSKHLYTSDLPDPDLLIRTSGEQRISNFLLWQMAYSEFVFTDTLWPDFTPQDFDDCIEIYNKRDRRYGRVESMGKI